LHDFSDGGGRCPELLLTGNYANVMSGIFDLPKLFQEVAIMFTRPVGETQNKSARNNSSSPDSKASQWRPASGAGEQILMLQRTIGNQATLRLLGRPSSAGPPLEHQALTPVSPRVSRKCAACEEQGDQKR
jgi:hypothetical protein